MGCVVRFDDNLQGSFARAARFSSPRGADSDFDCGRLQEVHQDREVTRLGEAVFQSGLLLPQNMQKTVAVLRRFQRSIQAEGADRVRRELNQTADVRTGT